MFVTTMKPRFALAPDDGGAGGGGGGGDFLAMLPEAIRGEPAFKDIADVGALATSFLNAQKLIGEKSKPFAEQLPEAIRGDAYFADVKDLGTLATRAHEQAKLLRAPADRLVSLPAPDDADGWNGVWNRLGRPEAADQYQLTDPKDLPPGLELKPENKAKFMAEAHALGLNQKQADAVWQQRNSGVIESYNAAIGEIRDGLARRDAALAERWGAARAQKEGDLNLLIDHLSSQFNLGTALRDAIDATPGDNGVAVKAALAEAGALMREAKLIGGGSGGSPAGLLSPAEAQQQINAMWADKDTAHTLRDQHATGHAEAVAKMEKLYQQAYPEPAAA